MLYIPEPVRQLKRRVFRRSDGERILRERFYKLHGGDLDNPRTFTEKVYCRMIDVNRHGNPTFTRLADKYSAREYIKSTVGEQYLVPLIWSGANPFAIPFSELPAVCIAKTNHGSGSVIRLHAPHDPETIGTVLSRWLRQNFYWAQREFQYYEIKPRVMIEECLDDGEKDGPLDYRFWCFHGKPEAIQVDNNSHSMNAFYTPSWEWMDCTYRSTGGIREAKRPGNLDELLTIAAELSAPFDFVRVDLYSVKGKTYCGEFTFTPTAGFNKFDPPEWDAWFGEKWR
jgi:hypothetical protein